MSSPAPLVPTTVGKRFTVGAKIGSGSFGDIYRGESCATGEEVAIKLERQGAKHPQLVREVKIYRTLAGVVGIPAVRWDGPEGAFNAMVLDLLGKSLEDLLNDCDRSFSLKTTLMLADQLLCRLEVLHAKSYIHRDVKPDNFLVGRAQKRQLVHVIDLGLSKLYQDPRTGRHVPFKAGKSLTGTARYASINAHMGVESSRRDDMESLGYMLVYFLKGALPWQGMKATSKKLKYEKIMNKKISISTEVLCKGLPSEFRSFFDHVRALRFEDKPDYEFLKRIFRELFFRQGLTYDSAFDWEVLAERELLRREEEKRPVEAAAGRGKRSFAAVDTPLGPLL